MRGGRRRPRPLLTAITAQSQNVIAVRHKEDKVQISLRLQGTLEKAIQTWTDRQRETDDWPDFITGEHTIHMMTNAAIAVLFACAESQEYAKREGYFD